MNSEFREMLSLLEQEGVEYLLVGGLAYSEYAEPRYTKALIFGLQSILRMRKSSFEHLQSLVLP